MPERFLTVAARFVFADLPERSLTLTSRDRQGANLPERFLTVAARFVLANLPERSLTLTSRDRQGANLPKRSLTVAARFVLADLPERFLTVAARFVFANLPERSLPGKSIAVELPFEINTANMGAFESGESFPWKDIPMRKASSCP